MTDTEGAPRRATIYERISSDPTGRLAGVERQDEDNHALAAQLGWDVVAVRRDNDVSAYSGKPRPGFRQLLEDLRTGHANAIIAWHPDRLYRRLPDLEELAKIVQAHGVLIRTVRAGAVDLSTASGIMTAEILASVSKHEVAHSIERITRAKAQAVKEGRYRGGPRPFGYEADGVTPRALLCPQCGIQDAGFDIERACLECGAEAVNAPGSEAYWAEWACEAVVGGDSLRSICARLAEAGVTTAGRRHKQADGSRGEVEPKPWGMTDLRRMLIRPRNAGLVDHDGEIAGKAQWAPIVAEETWRAACEILLNPTRRTSPSNARVWLLSGIAKCWCGAPMICTTTGTGGRAKAERVGQARTWASAYRCTVNAGHVVRRAVNLDEYIEGLTVYRLSRPDAEELLLAPARGPQPVRDLAAEANALRAKLDSIAADYAEDLMTRKQMIDATARTRARLDQVDAEMAARSSDSVLASLPLGTPEVGELWPDFHLDKKRAIITALMTITVNKARRGRPVGFKAGSGETYFDPDTIDVQWIAPE